MYAMCGPSTITGAASGVLPLSTWQDFKSFAWQSLRRSRRLKARSCSEPLTESPVRFFLIG